MSVRRTVQQRTVQYPWGATCPVYWPKAYAVLRLKGWDTHFTPNLISQLGRYCPNIELMETGELLLDITLQQRDYNSPVQMMRQILDGLGESLRHNLAIGLAGDALAAFLTVRQQQASLLNIVPAWDADRVLSRMPLQSLDTILSGVSGFLAQYELKSVADVQQLPSSYLTHRFGDMGKAIVLLSQNKTIPRSLWDTKPPVELGAGLVWNRAKPMDIAQLTQQKQRLEQKLAKRHYEAGQLIVEFYSADQSTEKLLLAHFDESNWQNSIQPFLREHRQAFCGFRLVAREIQAQRVQGELFAESGFQVA